MKAYLDSVSQHKIDETQSEQNCSFVSTKPRKESTFGQGRTNSKGDPQLQMEEIGEAGAMYEESMKVETVLANDGLVKDY
mmetsp:Transcript_47731/g.34988  ORF Transcript_47731/g.34988 Transcript_47731/m.34988 type:complete len:80 (+) Transcript_47731:1112-1351(+)|eukprot:CAMPEP_0202957368 /NCGR_PEP_ID=MMETSP1396-20130829/1776_1 /ASSEMBLY_ACC=CAM_ASM_000872 /TAXON_ID= /ORGANISM="Pseudokeronopsis sp., Strain Brazil" /LENGTH=79 /DNA_ID=CAMNT_0049674811 /DNA_START=1103 /DNA_END=1342 /DNA_ORIENTATION=-